MVHFWILKQPPSLFGTVDMASYISHLVPFHLLHHMRKIMFILQNMCKYCTVKYICFTSHNVLISVIFLGQGTYIFGYKNSHHLFLESVDMTSYKSHLSPISLQDIHFNLLNTSFHIPRFVSATITSRPHPAKNMLSQLL